MVDLPDCVHYCRARGRFASVSCRSHFTFLTSLHANNTSCSIYVGYPNIARDGVADSELVPTSESFLNPAPDSFDLELDTVLLSDSKFHPTLSPFNGSLYLDGGETPFAYINVPEIQAKNGTVAHVAQRVTIPDQVQFQNFCITALSSETYTLRLRGKGDLKQGSLQTISVNYDQPVESKGVSSRSPIGTAFQ